MSELVVATTSVCQPTAASISTPEEGEANPDAVLDRLFALPPWPPHGWESRTCPREPNTACATAWLKEAILAAELLDGQHGRRGWREQNDGVALRDAHRLAVRLGLDCPPPAPGAVETQLTAAEKLRKMAAAVKAMRAAPEPVPPGRRPCYDRDHQFLAWSQEGMTPAKIRNRWNEEHPTMRISPGAGGRDIVKKGIKTALHETER